MSGPQELKHIFRMHAGREADGPLLLPSEAESPIALTLDFFYDTVMLFPVLHNHMDNSHQTFSRRAIAGLAFAGVVSGLLTIVVLETLPNFPRMEAAQLDFYVPGFIFGALVSACFFVSAGFRFAAKWLGFVAASTAAYFLAVLTTMYVPDFLGIQLWVYGQGVRGRALFFGGTVGAFVLVAATRFLFSAGNKWTTVLSRAVLWSLIGGVLAVAGHALGNSLGKSIWLALHALHLPMSDDDLQAAIRQQTVNFFSLIVVWQTGMAGVLGLLSRQFSVAPAPKLPLASAAKRSG